jgi:hypothetical protein
MANKYLSRKQEGSRLKSLIWKIKVKSNFTILSVKM